MAQIEAHRRSGGRPAGHQLAAAFERSQTFIPGGESDVLDDDVDAFLVRDLADFVGNLLLVVVDAEVGAERASLFEFCFVACGGDDAAAKHFGDLDSGDAHAGACAQHQHRLSGAYCGESDQHVPCGHKYERDAGCLIEIQRVGNWDDTRPRHGDQLAVAAVDSITQNRELAALVLHTRQALHAVSAEMHVPRVNPAVRGNINPAVYFMAYACPHSKPSKNINLELFSS